MNTIRKKYSIIFGMTALLFASCSTMTVEDGPVESKYAGLSFSYKWNENSGITDADSMYCFLSRIQNTHHYFVKMNSAGAVKCDSIAYDLESVSDASLFDSKFYIKPGEYYMCSIKKPQEGMTIDNISGFLESTKVSLNDMMLRYVNVNKNELDVLRQEDGSVINWVSNQGDGYPYFRNILPVECEVKKNITISSNTEISLEFSPEVITQKVVIPFKIHVNDGVEIKNVLMEVSGVVSRRYLTKDNIPADGRGKNTGRVIVKPRLVSDDGSDFFYEAEVVSLGLMPNELDESSVGPGLIHLVVYAKAGNKEKALSTTKNISKFLRESGSVKYDDIEEKYSLGNHDIRLNTNFNFKIQTSNMSGSEDGVVEWEDEGNDIEGEA